MQPTVCLHRQAQDGKSALLCVKREAVQLTDLVGIIVHGDSAALAQREVNMGDRPIRHFCLLAPAAAQDP